MATREEDEIAALELTDEMSAYDAISFIRAQLGYDTRTATALVHAWIISKSLQQPTPAVDGGRA